MREGHESCAWAQWVQSPGQRLRAEAGVAGGLGGQGERCESSRRGRRWLVVQPL